MRLVEPPHGRWAGKVEVLDEDGTLAFTPSGCLLARMPVSAALAATPGERIGVRIEMREPIEIRFESDLVPDFDEVFADLSVFHRQGRLSSSNSIQKRYSQPGEVGLCFDPVPGGDYLLQGFVRRGSDVWPFELAMRRQFSSRRVRLSDVIGAWTVEFQPESPRERVDLVLFAPEGVLNEFAIQPTWVVKGVPGRLRLHGLVHASGRAHLRWERLDGSLRRESEFVDFDARRSGVLRY